MLWQCAVMSAALSPDPFGLAGTVLERKYRIDRVVAEGGFGIVYAGHHLALDLPVAIKVLKRRDHLGVDAWHELLARFVQEAQTMARLRHPHIASILDTGVAELHGESVPWMVLEWLEGQTLQDALLARRGSGGRTPAEALELLRPVLSAVAEAHDSRIAHRDLKPSNVMLVPTRKGGSVARVLDFGIAKVMCGEREEGTSGHTTTQETFRAFSMGYVAPEQVAGTRTGPWTDVHALGLMLSEVLTDQSPYAGQDATSHHALVFDPCRPTPRRFGVDVGVWEPIVARALALKPAERFANAGELLAALEAEVPRGQRAVARPMSVRTLDDRTDATMTSAPTRSVRGARVARVARVAPWIVAGILGVGTFAVLYGKRSAQRAPISTSEPSSTAATALATETATAATGAPAHPSIAATVTTSVTSTGSPIAGAKTTPIASNAGAPPHPPPPSPLHVAPLHTVAGAKSTKTAVGTPPPATAAVPSVTAPTPPAPSSTRPFYVPE
jgi:eukaryotic-like serine/threonine-protein kinase